MTIMASWFPIWALHREQSCKNVSVEFEVVAPTVTAPLCQSPPAPSSLMTLINVHSLCDGDDVNVCVCVCVCFFCHVRCVCHVRGCHEL